MAWRMARPSAAQVAGKSKPAIPPPVTHSQTRIFVGSEIISNVSFRIVPVIDLKGGMAVHAIGGRRDQYRVLRSVWQASASPVALAAALRDGPGIDCLYVADLDAIEGHPPSIAIYERMAREGLLLWIDAGITDRRSLESLNGLNPAAIQIVVGLESVGGPRELSEIVEYAGAERIIFSVDLDNGAPRVARGSMWGVRDAMEIVGRVVALGIRRLVALDLARVGTGLGPGTESLMTRLLARHDRVQITVGGGIRSIDDVLRLEARGASSVLVGSAMHDGRIGRQELERIASVRRPER
jgi:phosphoribosylformimino-5-aminoimidazole carboxamide ribotide isomerase